MSIAIKQLSELRSALIESGVQLAAAPKKAVVQAPSRRAPAHVESKKPSIPGIGKRPMLPSMNVEELVGQLVAIIDAAFAGRGFHNSMAFASHVVECLAAAEFRKGNVSSEKSVIRAIEAIVSQAGVHMRSAYVPATRGRRLLQMLGSCPGIVEGAMVHIDRKGAYVPVERPRDASNALAVFESYAGSEINQKFLGDLEVAKSTKLDSLNSPVLKRMRSNTPDLGAALITAALCQKGFTKAGLPVPNLTWMSINSLQWAVSVLSDLRSVLNDENQESRGRLFLPLLDEGIGMDYDSYDALAKTIARVTVSNGASAADQARIKARYEGSKRVYDEARASWNSIQAEFDNVQQEAINIVDGVLAFVRHKVAEKEWLDASNKAGHEKRASQPVQAAEPKIVVPAPRTKQAKQSANTPAQAVAVLQASGTEIEAEISLPSFNEDALGIAKVELRKTLAATGLDGARECAAYPGVIWEVVMGPLFHAMDLTCEEPDCRLLVIAPRRAGGMGLELSDARVLMLAEYEDYFSAVAE
jgi:hypothetical protein